MSKQVALSVMLLVLVNGNAIAEGGTEALSREREAIRVDLQVDRSTEINNDLMRVKLAVEADDKDATRLADKVNQEMQWALQQVHAYRDINAKSGNYRTYPVYREKSLSHWRAIQELQLKSRNMAAMSGLVAKLQSRLQVKSMTLTLSSEARRAAENDLIDQTMDAFRERADVIRTSLEAPRYRIVSISVTAPEGTPKPRPFANMVAAREVAPPAVTAGTTEVAIVVSGSIELPR